MAKLNKINKISEETLTKMKNKSMLVVPNNASEQGLTPNAIKHLSTDPLFNNNNSLYSEINRVVDEINGDGTPDNPGIIDEINNKLDKIVGKKRVYINDENGNPSSLEYSDKVIEGQKTVAVRGEDGRLEIEIPIGNKDAVNKEYFDYYLTFAKLGLLAVGEYDEVTGEIEFIFNADIIDEEDITYDTDTGILTVLYPKKGYKGGKK